MSKPNILVGSALYNLIKASAPELTKVVPVIADQETRFPFAVYRRIATDMGDNKDRIAGRQRATYAVSVLSDDYGVGLTLAQEIINGIIGQRAETETINVTDISLDTSDEDAAEGYFAQNLTITLTYNLK